MAELAYALALGASGLSLGGSNPPPRTTFNHNPTGRCVVVAVLGIIAALILASVVILQRFMKDMAIVEKDLLKEIREMKECLIRINEKQL